MRPRSDAQPRDAAARVENPLPPLVVPSTEIGWYTSVIWSRATISRSVARVSMAKARQDRQEKSTYRSTLTGPEPPAARPSVSRVAPSGTG